MLSAPALVIRWREEGLDVGPVGPHHAGDGLDGLQAAPNCPRVPVLKLPLRGARVHVVPQGHQRLLECPGPPGLELGPPDEPQELAPGHPGEPRRMPEPVELRADQPVVALGVRRPVLLPAHLVDRLVGVLGNVELVEEDLRVGVRQMGPGGGDVGLPHVHRHRLDGGQLGGGQLRPERVEARLAPVIGHVAHLPAVQVGHHRDVLVAPGERRFVDPQMARRRRGPPRQAALDRPRLDARRFIPTQPQPLRHRGDRGVLHPVDGQGLEQGGEPRSFLCPGDPDLANAMRGAAQPGEPGVDQGPVLARIQVAPFPVAVIVDGRGGQALGTDPQRVLRQGDPTCTSPAPKRRSTFSTPHGSFRPRIAAYRLLSSTVRPPRGSRPPGRYHRSRRADCDQPILEATRKPEAPVLYPQ
jgi:hypothetical protein